MHLRLPLSNSTGNVHCPENCLLVAVKNEKGGGHSHFILVGKSKLFVI